jgi:hypothetical protein
MAGFFPIAFLSVADFLVEAAFSFSPMASLLNQEPLSFFPYYRFLLPLTVSLLIWPLALL